MMGSSTARRVDNESPSAASSIVVSGNDCLHFINIIKAEI
jgi:hypothetical protein